MNTVTLTSVTPREETRTELIQHCAVDHEHSSITCDDIEDTVLENNGTTMEAQFMCPVCTYTVTEVYVLKYIQQVTGDIRYERGTTPTCDCETQHEEHAVVTEVTRKKENTGTAVAIATCNNCSEKWKDVFKYETLR